MVGEAVKPCVSGEGVPVAGSVGAAAWISQTTSPVASFRRAIRVSLVDTNTPSLRRATPRVVRDLVISGL
ncbi:hypothetical protein D3C83_221040 [compost metagenome]